MNQSAISDVSAPVSVFVAGEGEPADYLRLAAETVSRTLTTLENAAASEVPASRPLSCATPLRLAQRHRVQPDPRRRPMENTKETSDEGAQYHDMGRHYSGA